jgi:hypothetical protein
LIRLAYVKAARFGIVAVNASQYAVGFFAADWLGR